MTALDRVQAVVDERIAQLGGPAAVLARSARNTSPSFDEPSWSELDNGSSGWTPEDAAAAAERSARCETPPLKDYPLLTSADLRAMPPMRWLVHGVLPAEGLGVIFGFWGTGKGFFVLDLVEALATGRQRFFGHRIPSAASITYVVLEGQGGVPKRVAAIEHDRGYELPETVRFVFKPFKLTDRTDLLSLAAAIAAGGGTDVTIIDTLNRAAPGSDENSSADMGKLIEAVQELQALVGGLVLLVHHSGKEPGKGMRGHSSLPAAVDAAIELTRDGDLRSWHLDKAKDEKDGEANSFRLRVVELGEDAEGELITSCVVEPEQQVTDEPNTPRGRLPKGGNQKIVLDALRPLFTDSSMARHGQAGAPPMRPCIEIDAAVDRIASRLTVEPKRRKERAQQAITGLVASQVLASNEGWIWLA